MKEVDEERKEKGKIESKKERAKKEREQNRNDGKEEQYPGSIYFFLPLYHSSSSASTSLRKYSDICVDILDGLAGHACLG